MMRKLFTFLCAALMSVGMWAAPSWVRQGDAWNGTTETLTVNSNLPEEAYSDHPEIKHVIISDGVTSIGQSAFYRCYEMTSVTIGNNVTSIGGRAFYGCTVLTSVTFGNSVESIGEQAFYNCTGLTSVTIGNSVTSIGMCAFQSCSHLTSVTIGNSVTSIGMGAFFECSSLTSVTIPNSVTSIGYAAFRNCSGLTSIVVESGNTTYDSRANCNAIIETSTNTLIAGCKNTIIPNSVTSIGDGAFYGCTGLESITIPNSVTSIGNDAFGWCSGLTSVTIPSSVTSIGNMAFYGCSGLASVTILAESLESYGSDAFDGTAEDLKIYVPAGSVNTYKTEWSEYEDKIVAIPATLTVHDGTTSNTNVPVGGTYANEYIKCEMVYPASELSDMAGGTINKMMYYTKDQAAAAWTGTFQVFMKEVTDASISSFYGTDGATIVYEGTLDGTQSTMEITFSTPYDYNGGNLLVGVYLTAKGNWKQVTWVGQNVQGASVYGHNSSSLSSVPAAQHNFLPKTTFTYKAPAPAPTNLAVTPESITAHKATVTWNGTSESYVVSLGVYDYTATPTEFNVQEGFEGSMPKGWTHIGSGSAAPASVGTNHTHSGKTLKFGGATSDNVVVLPEFEVEANTLTIDFWSKAESTSLGNSGYFDLGYVTDATNSNTFVALEEYSCANHGSAYVHIENYSLAAVPAGARIAFRHRSGKTSWYWYIDDVTVSGGFVYPINWTEYSTSNQTYTFENLTPNTLYQVKVKGYSGDEGYSLETAPVGFTTATNPSGSCGANLSWEFDPSNGTLTITGTGAMDDYDYVEHQVPWLSSIDGITSVIIPDGVTRIGNCAFYACTALTSIEIPSSVTSIGDEAFYGCSLETVTVNATTPPTLGTDAFAGTAEGLKIYVPARSVDTYKAAWAAYEDKITTPTYTVTLKEGTDDADNWTIAPPEAKTTGVAEGTEVTATYSGTKLVKSVKAVKKAPAPTSLTITDGYEFSTSLDIAGCTTWDEVIAKNSDKIKKVDEGYITDSTGQYGLLKGKNTAVKADDLFDPNATDYKWVEGN